MIMGRIAKDYGVSSSTTFFIDQRNREAAFWKHREETDEFQQWIKEIL